MIFRKPRLESFVREHRHLALWRDTNDYFDEMAHDRRMIDKIDNARSDLRESRPDVDQSKRVGMDWSWSMFVVMREELGLIRRHVHIHGAIGLASFAG